MKAIGFGKLENIFNFNPQLGVLAIHTHFGRLENIFNFNP